MRKEWVIMGVLLVAAISVIYFQNYNPSLAGRAIEETRDTGSFIFLLSLIFLAFIALFLIFRNILENARRITALNKGL